MNKELVRALINHGPFYTSLLIGILLLAWNFPKARRAVAVGLAGIGCLVLLATVVRFNINAILGWLNGLFGDPEVAHTVFGLIHNTAHGGCYLLMYVAIVIDRKPTRRDDD